MTEKRLKEVLWDCTGMNADNHPSIIEAMKQAVNEAITESIGLCYDNLVDKPIIDGIRNLKVK